MPVHLCEHHLYEKAKAGLARDGVTAFAAPLHELLNEALKGPEQWAVFEEAVADSGLPHISRWVDHWAKRLRVQVARRASIPAHYANGAVERPLAGSARSSSGGSGVSATGPAWTSYSTSSGCGCGASTATPSTPLASASTSWRRAAGQPAGTARSTTAARATGASPPSGRRLPEPPRPSPGAAFCPIDGISGVLKATPVQDTHAHARAGTTLPWRQASLGI